MITTSQRIEAYDEVKALIAPHHAPRHWYFEWLINKMNQRVLDNVNDGEAQPVDGPKE